jgi:hypothetical protein
MLTAVWPEPLAGRVARLIARHPDLARRLALAPQRTLHALAIWLYDAIGREIEDEAMATAMQTTDARLLLAEAMPDHAPDLHRLLGRLGAKVKGAAFYRDLNAVLVGPAAKALPREGQITAAHLRTARVIAEFGKPLTHIASVLAGSDHRVNAAAGAVRYLRALGLARAIEETPPGAGWKSFASRLTDDLDAARSPITNFPVPPGWRLIETVGNLRKVGHALRLCVAEFAYGSGSYLNTFLGGKAVFLTSEEHKSLALVTHFGDEWVVTEISRRGYGLLPVQVRCHLEAGLRDAGLRVALIDPCSAVESVLSEARRRATDLSLAEDGDPAVA